MLKSTLCYIEKDDAYLMMHRTKKKNDTNHDKWIGIGGKIEKGESPDQCIIRETLEETGLLLTEYTLRGIINFMSDVYEDETMYLYTATGFEKIKEPVSDEGTLKWIPKSEVYKLPIWQGDKLFFKELEHNQKLFKMMLRYESDELVESSIER